MWRLNVHAFIFLNHMNVKTDNSDQCTLAGRLSTYWWTTHDSWLGQNSVTHRRTTKPNDTPILAEKSISSFFVCLKLKFKTEQMLTRKSKIGEYFDPMLIVLLCVKTHSSMLWRQTPIVPMSLIMRWRAWASLKKAVLGPHLSNSWKEFIRVMS